MKLTQINKRVQRTYASPAVGFIPLYPEILRNTSCSQQPHSTPFPHSLIIQPCWCHTSASCLHLRDRQPRPSQEQRSDQVSELPAALSLQNHDWQNSHPLPRSGSCKYQLEMVFLLGWVTNMPWVAWDLPGLGMKLPILAVPSVQGQHHPP